MRAFIGVLLMCGGLVYLFRVAALTIRRKVPKVLMEPAFPVPTKLISVNIPRSTPKVTVTKPLPPPDPSTYSPEGPR